MAAPLAHILLAVQILQTMPDKDEKAFIIGTSFPDIRYLGCISRDKTHIKNVTLDDIKKEKSSFKAGMMFHALVDEVREKYMNEHEIYKIFPRSKLGDAALKFNEDLLLFPQLNDLDKYAYYFDSILFEELEFIKSEYVKTWHKALKKYLLNFNDIKNRFKFLKRCAKRRFDIVEKSFFNNLKRSALLKVNQILYNKVEKLIEKVHSSEKIKALVEDFYNSFNRLV
ncbi:hypothetical protein A3F66_06935 [candidate division TM6 bacterium RIFCSPHIGHO2_12_FULL_32_22]|nr:MAG: hypothetical protein A3F66_06935 [candidate division TM6 bacterium RIFCSPHIGHO2_12_FULL_32_22]